MEGLGVTEAELELLDPHPDIHALFVHYNSLYFGDSLGACSVEWSSGRMTLCGGVCEWRPGGGCRIKLSEPLLKLRPSSDLKMVLLHEMIHAHLMLQGIRDDDPSGHGTAFKAVMARINASTAPDHQRPPGGYQITVTHSMFAEVEHYRQHHWRCERCANVVKRAMNRPPQEADCRGRAGRGAACADPYCRFHTHAKHCGGAWVKVKEPEGYKDKRKKAAQGADGRPSSSTAGGAKALSGNAGSAVVPAKRPRKAAGPGRLAAGVAGEGSRAITDFFPPRPQGPSTAPAGRPADPADAALPAIEAVTAAAAGRGHLQQPSQQQQMQEEPSLQQQQGPEPPLDERRRLLADAALRRLAPPPSSAPSRGGDRQLGRLGQGGDRLAGPAQQQVQEGPAQQRRSSDQLTQQRGQQHWSEGGQQEGQRGAPLDSPGYVDLVWSSDDADAEPSLAAPIAREGSIKRWVPAHLKQQVPAEGPRTSTADGPAASHPGAAASGRGSPEGGGGAAALECPMCGRRWGAGEISNSLLNAHVDECLILSHLKDAG